MISKGLSPQAMGRALEVGGLRMRTLAFTVQGSGIKVQELALGFRFQALEFGDEKPCIQGLWFRVQRLTLGFRFQALLTQPNLVPETCRLTGTVGHHRV